MDSTQQPIQNNNPTESCPLSSFTSIGGQSSVIDLIDKFYYKVLFDKTLRGFFFNSDMARVRFMQKELFAQILGDESIEYKGRDLIEIHKNLNISNKNFDTFKNHMSLILQDMKLEEKIVKQVLEQMEGQRDKIVFEKQQEENQDL